MIVISIITINYNNGLGLKHTLDSVNSQMGVSDCLEHIIIDGGSTDDSKDIIEQYAKNVKYIVRWVSEKDNGIYNAMNKGVKMASGKYVQFLNSGDRLATEHVIMQICSFIVKYKYPDILCGELLKIDNNKTLKCAPNDYDSFLQLFRGTINHSSTFIQAKLFDEYGLYDESLRIVSDWEWFVVTVGLGSVTPVHINVIVSIFDIGGVSEQNIELRNKERQFVLKKLLPIRIYGDYEKYGTFIEQYKRLQKYKCWFFCHFIERILFKLEKWRIIS